MELRAIRTSYWFRSGSLSLLNRIFITFFGFLNFLILVRILTPEDFGTWVIFLSVITLTESVRTTFMYNPLLRYLNSEEESEREHIVSASLILNLGVALFTYCSIVVFAFTFDQFMEAPQLREMLLTSVVAVIGFTFITHFNFLQQSRLKFTGTTIATFAQKVVLFGYVLTVYLLRYTPSLLELAAVFNGAFIIGGGLSFWFARKENVFTRNFKRSWITKLFHYGKFSIGTGLSSMLNKTSKEWLLGGMIGTSAVALFAPASRVSNLFQIPLGAIASVFFPELVNRVKDKNLSAAKYLYERSVAVILIAIIPAIILIFFLAKPIVLIIAGSQYLASVPVLQVIILAAIFEPFQRQFGVTMDAIGKAHINFYFVVLSSTIGIALNYIAILIFGIMGAAYGIFISYMVASCIIQYILYRQIDVSILNIFKYSTDILKQTYRLCVNRGIKYFRNG